MPSMHCDGKCFLHRQLKQSEQRKDGENGAFNNRMDVLLFCSDAKSLFSPDLHSGIFNFPQIAETNLPAAHFDFFHPPRA